MVHLERALHNLLLLSLRDLVPIFWVADPGLTSWTELCRRSAAGISWG